MSSNISRNLRVFGYNKWVKKFDLVITIACILIPLGINFVPISPLSQTQISASKDLHAAILSGDIQKQFDSIEMLLKFTPWRGDLWQQLGRIQMGLGDYTPAIDSFNNAQETGQLTNEGHLWLADAMISNGDSESARSMLRTFTETDSLDGFLGLQAAMLLRRINDPFGTMVTLLKILPKDPTNAEINFQLGLQLTATQPDSALKFLNYAVSQNNNRKQEAELLVSIIDQTSSLSSAADRFIYIGQALSRLEEWDVAQRAFQTVVDIDDINATGWALLAESAQQNGSDGLVFLNKAQHLDPNAEIVNGVTALYYRRQQKPEVALLYLYKALAANPKAAVWEIEIGSTLAEMGDLEKALLHYQTAIKIAQDDWTAYRALAVFSITHNFEINPLGIQAASKALSLNPGSPALMDLLGTGYFILGDLDSAERFFMQALSLDQDQAAIMIHLGQLYYKKGEKDKAITVLRRAVELSQTSRLREMALRLLSENGDQ
jgi:tetratricopeptide (TPR) repeat protein